MKLNPEAVLVNATRDSLDDGNKHELHWSSGHAHPREEHAAHLRLWVRRVGSTARVVAVEGEMRRLVPDPTLRRQNTVATERPLDSFSRKTANQVVSVSDLFAVLRL